MEKLRFLIYFISFLSFWGLLIFGTNSCTGDISFKDASDYDSQLDSTYRHSNDSFVLYDQYSLGDSLSLPSLAQLDNAIMISGYSWWGGYKYRCIISGYKDKKLQMVFRDLNTPDTIYKFKYHEKNLTAEEYKRIAKLIIRNNLLDFPQDLEGGRSYTDAGSYLFSIKEKDFFKATGWEVNDTNNREKKSAFQVHQAILKLSEYPIPNPYAKLKRSYDGSIDCKVGVYGNGLNPEFEVSYKGALLEKEDSLSYYDLSIPASEIQSLEENLVFVAKFEDGEKVILKDLVVDSTKLKSNQ